MDTVPPVANPLTCPPPAPPAPAHSFRELLLTWPRSAQVASALLIGGFAFFFGLRVMSGSGTAPAPALDRLDVNRASYVEWLQLPGIGPALADRIISYRHLHGPFQAVEDLRKVPGIGPATLKRLQPLVCVSSEGVVAPNLAAPPPAASTTKLSQKPANAATTPNKTKKELALAGQTIAVNHAGLTELQRLPGIGPTLAQRIIEERGKRPFEALTDLRRVKGIGAKTLEKIKPFITLGQGEPLQVGSRN